MKTTLIVLMVVGLVIYGPMCTLAWSTYAILNLPR